MKKLGVSVECAKSYQQNANDTAILEALTAYIQKLNDQKISFSLVLQVDDVTYPDKTIDFDRYAGWLGAHGYIYAFIARESQNTEACDKLLGVVDVAKFPSNVGGLTRSDGNYTAALYVASWCLLRLGYLDASFFPKELQADRIMNILPLSFKEDDQKALEIIKTTPYSAAVEQIDYQFIAD